MNQTNSAQQPGCATGYTPDIPNATATRAINNMKMEGVPVDKLAAMKDYAVELRRKFPHMKPARLQRKVADYFHIKLVSK